MRLGGVVCQQGQLSRYIPMHGGGEIDTHATCGHGAPYGQLQNSVSDAIGESDLSIWRCHQSYRLPRPVGDDDTQHTIGVHRHEATVARIGDHNPTDAIRFDTGRRIQRHPACQTPSLADARHSRAGDESQQSVRPQSIHSVCAGVGDPDLTASIDLDIHRSHESGRRRRTTIVDGCPHAIAGDGRQRAISLQTANDAVTGVRDQETARGIEGQCCGSP